MMRYVIGFLASIGFLVVLAFIGLCVAAGKSGAKVEPLPASIVLNWDAADAPPEHVADGPLLAALEGGAWSMADLTRALEAAAADPAVKAVRVTMSWNSLGLAQIEELRQAFAPLHAAGKPVFVFADSYGDFEGGLRDYYLAAGLGELWMQPVGNLAITGLSAEMPFARSALEKLGIGFEAERRKEFKNAFDTVLEDDLTPANRMALQSLLDDLMDSMVQAIALDRGIEPDAVRAAIGQAPLTAQEALDAGLLDEVGYLDQMDDAITEAAGKDARDVDLADYATHPHRKGKDGGRKLDVALIHGEGPIVRMAAENDGLFSEAVMSAEEIAGAFDEAADDDDIKAIIFRIDSPGGSPVASETIRRALVAAREAGKKVFVSMGNVAASGGYWIAVDADRIFADRTTLTGSIGVLAGKPVTAAMWQKLGINWARVATTDHSGMFSTVTPFSDEESRHFSRLIDATYADFTSRVAQGRKLEAEAVETVARGRVWTGAQAVGNGLVDQLGGLEDVMNAMAVELGGEGASARDLELHVWPRPDNPLEELLGMLNLASQARVNLGQARALSDPAATVRMPWLRLSR